MAWNNYLTIFAITFTGAAGVTGGVKMKWFKSPKWSELISAPVAEPTPTPTAAPIPTPTPTASSGTVSVELVNGQFPSIASEFAVNSFLVPSWGTGEVAKTASPDPVGAFRFICAAGQLSYDDPIVYPGEPGKSHLHQYFGNTLADAHSDYRSLRTTGDSTCNNKLNRSAYWMPAMLDGKGSVVRPDWLQVYYKRFPKGAAECTTKGKACVDLPRGLRYIFGFNMLDPTSAPTGSAYWTCQGGSAPNGVHEPNLTALRAACPGGTQIGAGVSAPECWNGKDLDSPDHRSHMAYQKIDPNDGQAKCPASHPYLVPTFSLTAWYTADANLPTWHLSSDIMPGKPAMTPGSSLHSDWFGAWDDTVMATWHANCIDKKLSCASGDLGNGWQMRMDHGYTYKANPRIVAVPNS